MSNNDNDSGRENNGHSWIWLVGTFVVLVTISNLVS
jgi:hypothetical protein